VQSLDQYYNWIGKVSEHKGYLCFEGNAMRNRTFNISLDANTLFMSHLKTDQKGYSQVSAVCVCLTALPVASSVLQNFTRAAKPFPGDCIPDQPCCSFRDDSYDKLVPVNRDRTPRN
jgi:hypothetical protein